MLLGPSGFLGLVGAWIRVLFSSKRFQASSRLRNITVALLGIGVATNLMLIGIYMPSQKWGLAGALLVTLFVGAFLVSATIGESIDAQTP